jgi:hypothetical protein
MGHHRHHKTPSLGHVLSHFSLQAVKVKEVCSEMIGHFLQSAQKLLFLPFLFLLWLSDSIPTSHVSLAQFTTGLTNILCHFQYVLLNTVQTAIKTEVLTDSKNYSIYLHASAFYRRLLLGTQFTFYDVTKIK